MENIHTISKIKNFATPYIPVAVLLVLGAILLVGLRLDAESYSYGIYGGDEGLVVYQGLNLIVNGEVDNFRAQEGVRWLVRAFYPYALVYTNTHMGGNVYINGWSYPGHNYIVEHFINSKDISRNFSQDPVLRDLFHALRQLYIVFVFACIFALAFFFLQEKYYLVSFGTIVLLGFSLDTLSEQKIFYIEPGMLASLALLILAYSFCVFRGRLFKHATILFGFLAAFMISTKFSTVLFSVLPTLLFFYFVDYREALKKLAAYILSLIGFYIVINFPAFISIQSLNVFIHDLSSNFWHYAAGSDSSVTVAPGITHLGLLTGQLEGFLGYALYVLPIIIIFAIYYARGKERMLLVPLLALVLLSINSLASQHVHLGRNVVPFFLPLAMISLLSIEIVARNLGGKGRWKTALAGMGVLSLLWIMGITVHAGGMKPYLSALAPSPRKGFVAELERLHDNSPAETTWYAVGFPKDFFSEQDFSDRITFVDGVPAILHQKNYPELQSRFTALPPDSIVLVNNIGNNKHLTHYILPSYFEKNEQFGNYFAFFHAKETP